jgi:hypothetical protein
MNQLSFHFKTTEVNGWPKIKITVDNVVIKEHCFTKEKEIVDVSLTMTDGPHVLEIIRYGKTPENLIFDAVANQIIKDQVIELTSMSIDGVYLPNFFLYKGVWHWEDNHEPSSLFWGPNGTWTWNFETPIIAWAISANRQHQDSHLDLLSPYKDDLTLSYKYLDQLEKAISELNTKNSTSQ